MTIRERVFSTGGLPKKEYSKLHWLIRKMYGKATKCTNPNCPNTCIHFQWALLKGRQYSDNINDYTQLCISCHRKYDFNESVRTSLVKRMAGKCYHNRERIVARFSDDDMTLYSSLRNAADENKMLHTSIANCLAGRSVKANGFIWKYRDAN